MALGNGINKDTARPLEVYVDINGNEWICDKEVISDIDPERPLEDQNIIRCQMMPFDHGG